MAFAAQFIENLQPALAWHLMKILLLLLCVLYTVEHKHAKNLFFPPPVFAEPVDPVTLGYYCSRSFTIFPRCLKVVTPPPPTPFLFVHIRAGHATMHCHDNVTLFFGQNKCCLLHYGYIRCSYSIYIPRP